MAIRVIICFVFSGVIGYLSYGDLDSFSSESFLSVMGVLLNVAAIVFAIIGAWIAIIYPKAIQSALSGDPSKDLAEIKEAAKDANYLSELFQIVLHSALVIVLAVSVQVALPLLRAYEYFGLDVPLVKAAAVSFMIFLSLLQINAISIVVEKNFGLLRRLREKHEKNVIDHDS